MLFNRQIILAIYIPLRVFNIQINYCEYTADNEKLKRRYLISAVALNERKRFNAMILPLGSAT